MNSCVYFLYLTNTRNCIVGVACIDMLAVIQEMKNNYPDFNILDETEKLLLGNIFEDVYLIDKRNGVELLHDDFYGDPQCGLISSTNEWAVIGGEHLTLWRRG